MFFSTKSFFQQILIDMLCITFELSLHLSCLLPAVPLSILFTPMQIRFTLKRLLSLECCLELLLLSLLVRRLLHLRNCRIDPCGECCYDADHVPSVDFLQQFLAISFGRIALSMPQTATVRIFVFVPTTQEMRSKCAETDPTYSSVSAPAHCAP